jgi:hypothetical protein
MIEVEDAARHLTMHKTAPQQTLSILKSRNIKATETPNSHLCKIYKFPWIER